MYSRQEASLIRKNFWTSFGQYMRPLPDAEGQAVNWLNYKTGIRHLYFRMDADNKQAAIAIELKHPDPGQRDYYFGKLQQVRNILEQETGEAWQWQSGVEDEDGNTISRVYKVLPNVNVFDKQDWSSIISFLKPRMLALDSFWKLTYHLFEI